MFVGDKVRVTELKRHEGGDRSAFVGADGELTQRLNVAWEPDLGALWRVRFPDKSEDVFAEAEFVSIGPDGKSQPSEIEALKETWGVAPRVTSMPFQRFRPNPVSRAVLAFLIFCVAGALLIFAGVAGDDLRLSAAGAALVLVGLGAAAVLVS